MSYFINLALRASAFFWALLVMALVGNIIASADAGNPSIINYDMFVAVFGMGSLFYLIIATIKEGFGVPIVTIALDALNVLFWFCAAVATAAYLGARSCSNQSYLRSNLITNGDSDNMSKRCRMAQASTAFLWFGFASFVGSLVFSVLAGRRTGSLKPSTIRSGGGPSMSQV